MKGDRLLSYAILLQPLFAIIQLLLPMFGLFSVEQSAELRIYAVLLSMVPAIVVAFRRNACSVIMPFLFYAILLLIHYVFFPASHVFIEGRRAITLTPSVILTGIFVYNIRSFVPFKEVFLWVSRLSVPLAVVFVWGHLNSPFVLDESKYDMSFGYTLLLSTLFLFTQERVLDKTASLLLWVLIVFGGSRGPAIVAATFYFISLLFYTRRTKIKSWQIALFFIIILAGTLVLPQLLDFSSSRTVMLLEEGEIISHDSNRTELYSITISKILESPIFGNGIGSDWAYLSGYCHNFFLEISLHYGLLVAALICIVIIVSTTTTYRKSPYLRTSDAKQLFVLIMVGGLMPLMVSSSYLLSANFGLVIGMLLRFKYGRHVVDL